MIVTDAATATEYARLWLATLHTPSPLLAARFMRDSKQMRAIAGIVGYHDASRGAAFRAAATVLEAASDAALGITPKESR